MGAFAARPTIQFPSAAQDVSWESLAQLQHSGSDVWLSAEATRSYLVSLTRAEYGYRAYYVLDPRSSTLVVEVSHYDCGSAHTTRTGPIPYIQYALPMPFRIGSLPQGIRIPRPDLQSVQLMSMWKRSAQQGRELLTEKITANLGNIAIDYGACVRN